MRTILYYALASPFIIVATVASFIMWNFLSTGEWRLRKPGFNPVILYQEQVASLSRQMREERQAHQAQMDEMRRQLEKERRNRR
jgi:hypothetical protein